MEEPGQAIASNRVTASTPVIEFLNCLQTHGRSRCACSSNKPVVNCRASAYSAVRTSSMIFSCRVIGICGPKSQGASLRFR